MKQTNICRLSGDIKREKIDKEIKRRIIEIKKFKKKQKISSKH